MRPRPHSIVRPRSAVRHLGPRVLALTLALVLAGCGTSVDDTTGPATSGDGAAGTTDADGAPDPAPDARPDVGPDDGELPDVGGADALRVLLGVVVLTTGDVDAAVAEGLVSPAELDLAAEAIAAREVSLWLARADLRLSEE